MRQANYSRRSAAWLIVVMAAVGATYGDAADAAPPAVPGQRIFICGHSFHVFVHPMLPELAKFAGIEGQEMVGTSRIGGSRVIQHWDVPDDKNELKRVLEAGKADVVTLAPIWLPDEGIGNFARLAAKHNPKVRVLVQEFWLPNDTYEPKYPLDTRKKVDHDATDVKFLADKNAEYCRDIEAVVESLNKELGRETVLVVPVGEASVRLREKITAGQAPGLKKQWDLFRDTWGHAKPPLQVLSAYCHFAVIYKRSPAGLGVPNALAKSPDVPEADKGALNRLLQEIAWETVRTHKLTGVEK